MRGGWGFEGSCGALVRGAVDGYAADVLRLWHDRVSVGHRDSVAAHRQDRREEVTVSWVRRKDLGGLRPIASLRALEYVCYAGNFQGHAPFCGSDGSGLQGLTEARVVILSSVMRRGFAFPSFRRLRTNAPFKRPARGPRVRRARAQDANFEGQGRRYIARRGRQTGRTKTYLTTSASSAPRARRP